MKSKMKSDLRRLVELLFQKNESLSGIARKVGRHRDTVRKMRTNLVLSELTEQQVAEMSDDQLAAALNNQQGHNDRFIVPDFDALILELGKPGKRRRHLYQNYVEQVSSVFGGGLRLMGRSKFYSEIRERQKARGLEYRHVYTAGSIMQSDFIGKRPFITDRHQNREYVELAVSVLPYSNLTFARIVRSQGLHDSLTVLTETLDYFGAVPANAIFDNFKAAVTTPKTHSKPAILNRHFKAGLDHYSIFPDPTYVAQPRHKGAVENAVSIVTNEFIGSERFFGCSSLSEMNDLLMGAGFETKPQFAEALEELCDLQKPPDARIHYAKQACNRAET